MQLSLRRKAPPKISPSKRAFEKYKPQGLFSEFYSCSWEFFFLIPSLGKEQFTAFNFTPLGRRLTPLSTPGGMSATQGGQHFRQSPLGQYEDYNHNMGPLEKDKTFIKSKSSPSSGKKSTPPAASANRPSRLKPMSNPHTPSPSYNTRHSSSASYSQPTEQSTEHVSLVPCHNCGRSFAADRLAKHESICNKSGKQRKVFDSTKMRTQGTDAAKYNRPGARKAPDPPKSKSNWRQKHGKNCLYLPAFTFDGSLLVQCMYMESIWSL